MKVGDKVKLKSFSDSFDWNILKHSLYGKTIFTIKSIEKHGQVCLNELPYPASKWDIKAFEPAEVKKVKVKDLLN